MRIPRLPVPVFVTGSFLPLLAYQVGAIHSWEWFWVIAAFEVPWCIWGVASALSDTDKI